MRVLTATLWKLDITGLNEWFKGLEPSHLTAGSHA